MLNKNQESSMRHLLSVCVLGSKFIAFLSYPRQLNIHSHVQSGKRKVYKIFTCFSFSHACHSIFQSVHFPFQNFQHSLSASLEENVMNENVFYVILHNIIVFNKQIPLSLHLIVKRTSQKLSTRSRFI